MNTFISVIFFILFLVGSYYLGKFVGKDVLEDMKGISKIILSTGIGILMWFGLFALIVLFGLIYHCLNIN